MPASGVPCAYTVPGSRWLAGAGTYIAYTCRKRRSAKRSEATPFCAQTTGSASAATVSPATGCHAQSASTPATSWVFVAMISTSSERSETSPGPPTAGISSSDVPNGVASRSPPARSASRCGPRATRTTSCPPWKRHPPIVPPTPPAPMMMYRTELILAQWPLPLFIPNGPGWLLVRSAARQQVTGDRRGGDHVERVHARAHGDADRLVGFAQPAPGQAVALGAEQQGHPAAPRFGEGRADRSRLVVRCEREDPETAALELGEPVEPFGHPGVRDGEHGAHGDLDRPPVERVGAPRREQHRVHAERGGAAEDRAHVRVVDEVFQDHDPCRVAGHLLYGWQWLAAEGRERAAVHAVSGEPFGDLIRDDVHRNLGGRAECGQVPQPALRQQHRAHRVSRLGRPRDDLCALRHEQAVLSLQVRSQGHVGQPRVIRQPRVGGAADLYGA